MTIESIVNERTNKQTDGRTLKQRNETDDKRTNKLILSVDETTQRMPHTNAAKQ